MHTGYDNYWINQNNRPEPLLSLPVSDIISHAVLTDSYKQGQNGELPSHFNNYKASQKVCQSNYHRVIGSQSMWPYLAYQYPSRASNASNFHLQNFLTHSSHLRHSSQKNIFSKNADINFGQTYNQSNHPGYNQNQTNKTTNGQTSRIQVKNVFSLNNSSEIQNPIMENSLFYQKEAHQFQSNYRLNHNRAWDCNSQPEYVDYEKINLETSSQRHPTYESCATEQKSLRSQRQYIPTLEEVCNQFNFVYNSGAQVNSVVHGDRNNTSQILSSLLSAKNVQETVTKNGYGLTCSALQRNKKVKINPKKNFCEPKSLEKSSLYTRTDGISNKTLQPDVSKQNETLTQDESCLNDAADIQSHSEESYSNFNQSGDLLTQSPVCSELRKFRRNERSTSIDNSPSDQLMNQESSVIKITIPHTGESTYINLNDPNNKDKSQNLSLPCLLADSVNIPNQNTSINDSNNAQVNENITFSTLSSDQRNLMNHNFSHDANPVCNTPPSSTQSPSVCKQTESLALRNLSPSNQSTLQKELFTGFNSVGSPSKVLPDSNIPLDNAQGNSSVSNNNPIETVPFNKTVVNVLQIKQEHVSAEEEVPSERFDGNSLQNKTFHQDIKSEKNYDERIEIREHKIELQLTEKSDLFEGSSLIDADNTENIDFTQLNPEERVLPVQKTGSKAKTMSTALKDAENRIQNPEMPEKDPDEEKSSPFENKAKDSDKDVDTKKNYKSQINRDKLDLLIKFLKKDEETVKVKNHVIEKPGGNKPDSNHNRRKLSKTCIVKNKNNSREMVSLVSHRTPRTGANPLKTAIVQTGQNFNKSEERKVASINEADRNVEDVKSIESSKLDDTQKNNVSLSEPQSRVSAESEQKVGDKSPASKYVCQDENSLISIMQALQKLKTHLCISCSLVSAIDSFWVNVVSGELRCLNCFKKMTLKAIRKNISNTEDNNSREKFSEETLYNEKNSEVEGPPKPVFGTEALERNPTIKEKISKIEDLQGCPQNLKKMPSPKKKNSEERKVFKMDESLKSNKSKESVTLKTRGLENSLKLKEVENFENLKRKRTPSDDFGCASKIQNSEDVASPGKSRKSSFSEICTSEKSPESDSEPFSDNTVIKNVAKECSLSAKSKSLKKSGISEGTKIEAMNKSEKSPRKKDVSEMQVRKEKSQEVDLQNQSFQRSSLKDFNCRKVQEENTKEEVKEVVNSCLKKLDLNVNCVCDKTRTSEELSKKSTKCEGLDKTKVQDTERKQKKDFENKSSRDVSFQHASEINKKTESVEQSRKRKNSEEHPSAQKVRIVEHAKKSLQLMAPNSDKLKTNFSKEDNVNKKKAENEYEKSKKHKLFKETYEDFEYDPRKEGKHEFEFSQECTKIRSVLKSGKGCEKLKPSNHLRHKANVSTEFSNRKSQDCASPKNGISKETSKTKIRKSVESPTLLKKNYTSKKENGIRKALEQSKKDSPENQENKKTASKKLNGILKKIPKIGHRNSDANYHKEMRSPLYDGELPNPDEVSKYSKEIESEKNRKEKLKNTNLSVKTQKIKDNKVANKKAYKEENEKKKNVSHSEMDDSSFEKKPKIFEGRSDTSKQSQSSNDQNEKHHENCSLDGGKKNTFSKACRESSVENCKKPSVDLLEKLLKKTKKLSWSLLGEAKKI